MLNTKTCPNLLLILSSVGTIAWIYSSGGSSVGGASALPHLSHLKKNQTFFG